MSTAYLQLELGRLREELRRAYHPDYPAWLVLMQLDGGKVLVYTTDVHTAREEMARLEPRCMVRFAEVESIEH